MSYFPFLSFLVYSNKRPCHPFPIAISRFYRSKGSYKISQFYFSLTCRPLGSPRYSRAEGQRPLSNSWLPIKFLWPPQGTCINYYSSLSTLITGIEQFISEQAITQYHQFRRSCQTEQEISRL